MTIEGIPVNPPGELPPPIEPAKESQKEQPKELPVKEPARVPRQGHRCFLLDWPQRQCRRSCILFNFISNSGTFPNRLNPLIFNIW